MTLTQSPATSLGIPAGTWNIDPSHSSVEFSVRHLVGKTRGQFKTFSGTITVAEDILSSSVEASIDLASVDTGDAKRDEHLRSPEFFDVQHNPEMTFRSISMRPASDDYVLTGELALRGVSREVDLKLEFQGVQQDPWGGTRAGFTATTELSRKEFGLEWNVALEAGGFLIGDKVRVSLEVEAVLA